MKRHRVILVDDEVYTRKGLVKLIDWEACGFHVAGEADNGEDALELIRSIRPDLVITDIRMPVLDGLGLIRQLIEEEDEPPVFVIISGYDDFSYAQQAVRYGVHDFILKPIDEAEFMEMLSRLDERLRQEQEGRERKKRLANQAMIESIIKNEAEESFVADWEKQLNMTSSDFLYYVFVELNDHHLWGPTREEMPLHRFLEQVEQVLQDLVGAYPLYVHEHRNRVGVIVPERVLKPYRNNIRSFAEALQGKIKVRNGRVFIYAGCPVQGLAGLRSAYESAKEALLYKYVYDRDGIVIHSHSNECTIQYVSVDQELYHRLIEQIEEFKLEELECSIKQMFRGFQEKRYAPEAVKMNIHQSVLGVIDIIRSMDGEEQSLESLAPIIGWHDLNFSLQELQRLFTTFAVESGRYIGDLRKEQQRGGIHKIRTYIEEHYHENISLKSIAAIFYMNPVYLGQLFRKTYGVYFNDFLLRLRIGEAKRLLRQTDLRIYEVADRVGFSNPDYFVTQFEKLEKLTPSEYRSRLVKGGASARTSG
ncbi:response regulator [Paenibacillus lentus]|uniref:Response regulator n=1 Tax=Paenibacillus lentus TaxID=1338368 RepID=A0A3Q8S4L4_9BACL|nr:response regulator [Paenibacillus lentus]AZK46394.1 response regulator [Paenibacillus lentus]